ncbi:hypothetical protein [Streptomyces sp. NPDC004065]|uniref:hypothetical protein n=1 Tax=Streptomyces sp. NPDC004065 TaxID=3364689 RepID=UPI003850D6AC
MTDAPARRQQGHEDRTDAVPAPHGPLAPACPHWPESHPDGRIPDNPGTGRADGDAVVLTAATAARAHALGRPVPGRFTRYAASRTVRVPDAGGRERGPAIPAGERTVLRGAPGH